MPAAIRLDRTESGRRLSGGSDRSSSRITTGVIASRVCAPGRARGSTSSVEPLTPDVVAAACRPSLLFVVEIIVHSAASGTRLVHGSTIRKTDAFDTGIFPEECPFERHDRLPTLLRHGQNSLLADFSG